MENKDTMLAKTNATVSLLSAKIKNIECSEHQLPRILLCLKQKCKNYLETICEMCAFQNHEDHEE